MADIEHATLTADYLHGAFPYGLLSARPTVPTNTYNPYYYATDNKKLYLYNGSAWAEAYVDVDASNFTSTGVSSLTNLLCPKLSCSTASATAAKTAAATGFILRTGARVSVTFTNENTATAPTLNIESTGDKAIYTRDGVAVSATNLFRNLAGETCQFYYDGTNWVVDITKSKTATYAMPSATYDNLTLGATGSTYTAPANGYYYIGKTGTAAAQFLTLETANGVSIRLYAAGNGSIPLGFIPVRKGDVVTISYNMGGAVAVFRFIYAQGEV